MQKIISIQNGVTRMPEWRMAEPVNFEACDGEHIAIVGPNGGGKSMFVDILVGRHPLLMHDPDYDFSPSTKPLVSDNIKYITFRDTYGGDNDRTYFLQQRWNQLEIDENTPIVKDKLEEAYQMAGEDTPERRQLQEHIYELFHMHHLLDKYTILLSSGRAPQVQACLYPLLRASRADHGQSVHRSGCRHPRPAQGAPQEPKQRAASADHPRIEQER